jgi:cell division transport system permease protein
MKTHRKSAANNRYKRIPENYLRSHIDVLIETSAKLIATPVASLMTIFVIGIALLLPALLQVVGNNLDKINDQFQDTAVITLYLRDNVTEDRANDVSEGLLLHSEINETRYISKTQALAEFSDNSGFGATIAGLSDNPFPASIVVFPSNSSIESTRALYDELQQIGEVDVAQIDLEWIQRLVAMRAVIARIGLVLTTILSLAVLFIVGNTIRLAIENHKSEIQIIRLVGGTNSFIARPFLYMGLLLGAFGALVACLLIVVIQFGFSSLFDNLLSLYGAVFLLQGYGVTDSLTLLLLGSCLGWAGALVSTTQHLFRLAD